MPIEFNCARCNKRFTVADSAAGKTGRCNECGNLNSIPSAAAGGATESSGGRGGMFEVTSGINGSVFGPADRMLLDQWLSEDRITPECQIKEVGTDRWITARDFFPDLRKERAMDVGAVEADGVDITIESDERIEPFGSNAAPIADPFDKFKSAGASGMNTKAGSIGSASTVNPFEASSVGQRSVTVSTEIVPTTGEIGFIVGHAFSAYRRNFGIVFGCSLLFMMIMFGLGFVGELLNNAMGDSGKAVGGLLNLVVTSFLGAGIFQLLLKVGRGEPVKVEDMFSVVDRWLPVIGYTISLYLVILVPVFVIGIVIAIVTQANGGPLPTGVIVGLGFSIIFIASAVMSLVWPGYFLVVDRKAKVFEAFGLGFRIAKKNVLQSMALFSIAGLISWAGLILFCVGFIFSFPLGMLVIACAYLVMSGQVRQ